ncbi:hypothetical protein CTI12_AA248880 [Artemisia annua]|uniref:Cytochrome P450 n=1 Tax=Artemisia annua TaxID=35608 RepID=A0A2U1NMK2_ARTAN|nr:hypothetical protein CTI12_AA248880 [Artemisia annua]
MAKEILRSYEPSFLDRPRNSATVYITYGSKDFVFAPFDSYWKFMKKLVVSELLNSRTLDSLFPVRQDEINRFMNLILGKAKLGKAVDLKSELLMLTNNVITRMLLSERCSEDENEARDMGKLVPQMLEITGEFNLADYIWFCSKLDLQGIGKRIRKVRQQFDDFMERVIKEHEDENRRKDEVKDLLDILLKISQDDAIELKLTKDHIKAFIQCFEWKAGEKGDMTQVDMEEGPGLALSRANPLVCVPVARLDDSVILYRM